MGAGQAQSSRMLEKMASPLRGVRTKLHALGLNLTVWDRLGRCVDPHAATNDFCRMVCCERSRCREVMAELAELILAEGKPAKTCTTIGCCLLGVPLRQRRRLVGAAIVCFPVREMLDEEFFSRLCDRLELDRQAAEKIARRTIRHGADEADDFLQVFTWLLSAEQGHQNSQDELANLSMNLATTYEELSLLYQTSGSMKVTGRPQDFLEDVCDELCTVLNLEAMGAKLYAYPPAIEQDVVVCAGSAAMDSRQFDALLTEFVAPRMGEDTRAFVENDFEAPASLAAVGQFRNLIAPPLVVDQDLIGMMVGVNKEEVDFDSVDQKLINSIGNLSAVFLANHRLYADLQSLLMGVLHALTAAIDAKDPYTCGHSQRVALISRRLAEEMGWPEAKVQQVYLSGLLHDIGKIGVPERVLCKPGRLTREEFQIIKRHPLIGARILGGIRQLDHVSAGILMHHERLDGTGYPNGLKGDELLIEGLMVGLADGLDAMTSDRTYRKALPVDAAIAEIRKHAGTQFDRRLVNKLLSIDVAAFIEEIRQSAQTVLPISIPKEPRA